VNSPQVQLDVIRDSAGLAALRSEWGALWKCSAKDNYELSHSVVWHAWNIVAKPQGHQLCIVIGRSAGRVVLIWPAIVRHEKF